jgi:hypothetical protein
MDSTHVIEPVIGILNSVNLLFLVYAGWLVWSGSPVWFYRARPTSTRPIVLVNNYFRVAGGIYIGGYLLVWIFSGWLWLHAVIEVSASIAYLAGLWKSLAPKVL